MRAAGWVERCTPCTPRPKSTAEPTLAQCVSLAAPRTGGGRYGCCGSVRPDCMVRWLRLRRCRLVAAQRHVLCVGETGTGKTLNMVNKLLNDMPPEVQPLFMTFSARTSANQTQVGALAESLHESVVVSVLCVCLYCVGEG